MCQLHKWPSYTPQLQFEYAHPSPPLCLRFSHKYGKWPSQVSHKMRINALALGEHREPLSAARAKLVSMGYLCLCLPLPPPSLVCLSLSLVTFERPPPISNGCKCRHKPKAPRAGPVQATEGGGGGWPGWQTPSRSGNGTIIAGKSKQPTEDVKSTRQLQLNCTGILPKDITRIPLIHEDLHNMPKPSQQQQLQLVHLV